MNLRARGHKHSVHSRQATPEHEGESKPILETRSPGCPSGARLAAREQN